MSDYSYNRRNYDSKYLDWDTQYFGVNCAKVNIYSEIYEEQQQEIIDFSNGYDFVSMINFGNIYLNNYWIGKNTNAFLSDINIQFIKYLNNSFDINESLKNNKIKITNNLTKNDDILFISKNSFKYSRFFNDKNIPMFKAKNIYFHWTESSFKKEDKYFVLFEEESKIKGYILFSFDNEEATIELIAVNSIYKGRNIGRRLVNEMEKFLLEKSINIIKVGTQINNISAINFYSHLGFKYLECRSIYHLWRK